MNTGWLPLSSISQQGVVLRAEPDIITARATAPQASFYVTALIYPFTCSSYSGTGQGHGPAMKKHFCSFRTSRLCLHQAQDGLSAFQP